MENFGRQKISHGVEVTGGLTSSSYQEDTKASAQSTGSPQCQRWICVFSCASAALISAQPAHSLASFVRL
jgi:hypothetical protein